MVFLIIYIIGIILLWISFLMAFFEAKHRFKALYPDTKTPKHSRISRINSFLRTLIHSIIPVWNWVMSLVFIIKFDYIADESVRRFKKLCDEETI